MCLAFALSALCSPALAGGDSSDGHSHAAPAPAAVGQSIAPRAVAATESFEVVAVLEDKKLVVYVDHFASNEPVVKARVEVDGAGLKGVATEWYPGTYLLEVATALPPARHALTISIETSDAADLLTATLDTSAVAASVTPLQGWGEWAAPGLIAALLLFTGLLFAARRRTRAGIGTR